MFKKVIIGVGVTVALLVGVFVSTGNTTTKDENSIVLTSNNTVVLNKPFTEESVQQVQQDAIKLSRKLKKTDTIHLFLNSPGGDISSGKLLIETLNSLPQKVDTITLFSASMSAMTVESLNDRYILPYGTIMMHPAFVQGMGGYVPGQLDSRVKALHQSLELLESKVASRMGITLKDYEKLVDHELWLEGQDAVDMKTVDKVVSVICDKSLDGTYKEHLQTFFGPVTVEWSKCPLLTAPVSVDFTGAIATNQIEFENFKDVFLTSINNREEFVQNSTLQNNYFKYVQ
jgi:ATP-dependent Clp protease, protease subunit